MRNREGFVTINPPLPTFDPASVGDEIMGYVLARHQRGERAFYVLQLTEPYRHNGVSLPAGRLVAVLEVESLEGMRNMLPAFVPSGKEGIPRASYGYEVVIEPFAESENGWQHLVHAKRWLGSEAKPPLEMSPAYPLLATMSTELEESIAARAQLEQVDEDENQGDE